jgi:hypothetical protein
MEASLLRVRGCFFRLGPFFLFFLEVFEELELPSAPVEFPSVAWWERQSSRRLATSAQASFVSFVSAGSEMATAGAQRFSTDQRNTSKL